MKIVITLGGNALLRRGEALSAENQRRNIETAVGALAKLASKHDLVLSHGNGPQVGLLAMQNEAYAKENSAVPTYPFDILGAQSQAMVGYMFAQALSRALKSIAPDRQIASIITQSEVDPEDPAFSNPTKFIGAMMTEEEARQAEQERGWIVKQDGSGYRRVIASPMPIRIVEFPVIKHLVETGTLVISCGGGGVPVVRDKDGLHGVEAVIDKDFAGGILATELHADMLIIATDVDGVYENWGTPQSRLIRRITPKELMQMGFSKGSMGPKIEAVCQFVKATGRPAAIGSLDHIEEVVAGESGTWIVSDNS